MTRCLSRREALRLGAGTTGLLLASPLLSACALETGEDAAGGGDGALVFVSSQLAPTEEAEKMRREILAGYEGEVEFIGEEGASFIDRVLAEARAGQEGNIGVLGALHGEFSTLQEEGALSDLSDLLEQLSDRNFTEQFVELARFGGDTVAYIPWMQASYIMAARREALDLLPGGDPSALTYDGLVEWGRAIREEAGSARLGWPAGPDGLMKRFIQGYSLPSFTGGVNTTFASDAAVDMWEWMKEAWSLSNPQSVNYAFMQEPLLSGEVWVAWDHTARLIEALRSDPEAFVAFPAPSGPEGRGYMPVVAGLGIPENAPDPERSRGLIDYLTRPETARVTLQQVAFFPPFELQELGDLEPAVAAQGEALQAQIEAPDALPSLLPVGLGDQGGIYDEVFIETFERIVLDEEDVRAVLDDQAARLQEIFDATGAPCWLPDPEGAGPCRVG